MRRFVFDDLLPGFLRGRIILCLLLIFTGGIVAAEFGQVAPRLILWAAIPAAAFPLGLLFFRKIRLWAFLPLAFVLGAFLSAGENAALAAWDYPDGHTIVVSGRVLAVSEREENWRAVLAVESADGAPLRCADIYLYGEGEPPGPGSVVEARGVVFTPAPYANANAFDYNCYLQREGIGGSVSALYTGRVTIIEEGPDNGWKTGCALRRLV